MQYVQSSPAIASPERQPGHHARAPEVIRIAGSRAPIHSLTAPIPCPVRRPYYSHYNPTSFIHIHTILVEVSIAARFTNNPPSRLVVYRPAHTFLPSSPMVTDSLSLIRPLSMPLLLFNRQ
ncbi:hypothetical protein NXS19_003489 [Fusarium pseudograminearum]|nr:hypothetical protein NXS19_003489 [Fusarium pseudograminearum]